MCVCDFVVGLLFGTQPRSSSNPVRDVQQFTSQFETDYGANHPSFLCCSYGDVSRSVILATLVFFPIWKMFIILTN